MSNFGEPTDLLASTRRVMLSGSITATTASEAAIALMYLDGLSAEPVTVMLNAGGGSVDDVVGLIDTMALMRAPLTVEVRGRAHGAAGVVAAAALGERTVGPLASISLRLDRHALSSGAITAAMAQAEADRVGESLRRLAVTIGARTGQTIEWVLDQFDRGATFDASAAIEQGLADSLQ